METRCQLGGQESAFGDVVSVLDAPATMFWTCMPLFVTSATAGFLAGIADGGCKGVRLFADIL